MASLIGLVTLPFLLLNTLGGIVAFIWLAILGEWRHLFTGIAAMALMPFAFMIAQLPGMLPTLAGTWFADRGWKLPMIACLFVGSLWTSLLIFAWCALVAITSVADVDANNKIPILLWGYAVAMGPLGYMAGKERDNIYTGLQAFLAQVYYVAFIGCWFFQATEPTYLFFIAIALFIFPVISLVIGAASMLPSRAG